ncbi:hypothetical protein BGX21_003052 [Mortierella sp. AD011]|nr:hypothetical protein BGX21_003052 [Mortierella sp. AD011]
MYNNLLGISGLTAYIAVLETLGGLSGLYLLRCRATAAGSAGSPAKEDYLLNDLGLDDAFDNKAQRSCAGLDRIASSGIGLYINNIGD